MSIAAALVRTSHRPTRRVRRSYYAGIRRVTVLERPSGPNLFELFPDMVEELRALTLGGRPMFDDEGNLRPYVNPEAEEAP
jgi:hypothetical protein